VYYQSVAGGRFLRRACILRVEGEKVMQMQTTRPVKASRAPFSAVGSSVTVSMSTTTVRRPSGAGAQPICSTFVGEGEGLMISDFWAAIRTGDVVVGHNVLDFDLRFLKQRSWILGIRPSRTLDTRKYYTGEVIDTLQLWTNWSGNKKGVTLDALGVALGCGGKTSNGADVARWWAERDIESIKKYCRDDVRLAYLVFCRLTYREPKPIVSDMQAMSAARVEATIATEVEEDACLG
jgi:DNA polymerase elongation subunit (family B)